MHVEHFMTREPVSCDADMPVADVAALMRDRGVGCVVVLRNGRVSGIVTDRQLAVRVLADGLSGESHVGEIMTEDPVTVSLSDNIFTALDAMRQAGVARRVPVVDDDGTLLGIVSISDIAVVTRDLIDGILLEETQHALAETNVATGGKRILRDIRRGSGE